MDNFSSEHYVYFFWAMLIVASFISYLIQRKETSKMQLIAEELGLSFRTNNFSSWKIIGNYKNSFLEIFTEKRSSVRRKYTVSSMTAIQPLPFQLEITRRGRIENSFKKLFNISDIQTGDENFDRMFTVKGDNPEEIKKMLNSPIIQDAIYALMQNAGFVILSNGIYYEESGVYTDINFYKWFLPKMSSTCDAIYGNENN